jgi:multiple sugar transport system permease protein
MAGAALMVIPIVVVFVMFQRYIVQGFTMSGLR